MRRQLATALGLALAATPLLLLTCYATVAVPCCFGVVCPDVEGCQSHTSEPSPVACKRTCTPACTNGNGCCEYQTQVRTYSNCTPKPADCNEVVSVSWSSLKHCRPYQAGNEVGCLETAVNSCNE